MLNAAPQYIFLEERSTTARDLFMDTLLRGYRMMKWQNLNPRPLDHKALTLPLSNNGCLRSTEMGSEFED